MPLSAEKVAAYRKLDEAVDALTAAYHNPDDPVAIQFGYLLIVGQVAFDTDGEPDDDEQDVRDIIGSYSKRGQSPTISCGLANEWLRHYNDDRD